MDRRKGLILGLFALVVVYVIVDRAVYPRWIEPLTTLDQRIAAREQEYELLKARADEVAAARQRYKEHLVRTGTFEISSVETDVRDRINRLIERHRLSDARVNPGRAAEDRRTGLTRQMITVTATASLASTVQYLRDLSELPQPSRIANVRIRPVSSGRTAHEGDRMNVTVPVEIQLPPQTTTVGRFELPEDRDRPVSHPRHLGRDYALIWNGKPFSEYVPLQANAGPDIQEQVGRRVVLRGSASGGDGPYTYEWTPSDGLDNPARPTPTVETSSPFQRTYTLRVTDSRNKTTTANVRVSITSPPKPPEEQVAVQPQRTPPRDPRWPDRRNMQLRMTLLASVGSARYDEVMVYDSRQRQSQYYAVGDEFDGGELVFVHPTGALIRRSGEYFIYPIGEFLDGDIRVDSETAAEFPDLVRAAEWARQNVPGEKKSAGAAAAQESAQAQNGQASPPIAEGPPLRGRGPKEPTTADTAGKKETRKADAEQEPRTVGRVHVGPMSDEMRARVQRFRDATDRRRKRDRK